MTPEQLSHQIRAFRTAEPVLRLFRAQVLPRHSGPELGPYLRVLMAKARNLNEGLGALDEALPLWGEAYTHNDRDGKEAVIRTLMSVAGDRLGGRDAVADVPAAVRLYEAAFRLRHSPDQCVRILKTMMSAANRFSDTTGPAGAMNLVAAVQLWSSAWRLHLSDDDRARILRTMMDVANRLSSLERPDGMHVDGALRIWRGLGALDLPQDDHQRLCRTMMDVANRLAERRRADPAADVWRGVHALEPDPDGRLRVVKTMMAFANRWSDAADPASRDLGAALAMWDTVAAVAPEESDRVAATMMAVASRLADTGAVADALQLWRALGHQGGQLGLQKAIVARAARSPELRAALLPLLRVEAPFEAPLRAAILYYDDRFDDVLTQAAGPDAPAAVRALRADALRKLGRHDEAIRVARAVVARRATEPEEQDAAVSALSCMAYCLLEKARAGESVIGQAEAQFLEARAVAERAGLPVPPRVHSRLGYVYQLQKRPEDARVAFELAHRADPDNVKAIDALAVPSPQLRTRLYEDLPLIQVHPHVLGGAPTVAGLPIPTALERIARADLSALRVEGLTAEDVMQLLEFAARRLEVR